LCFDSLDHLVELCFHDYSADYHLAKCRMQRLEVEDQVELAHIFEEAVESLYEDLDEVEEGEGRLGGGADHDEVQSGIVAVGHERRRVVVRGCRVEDLEELARRGGRLHAC
jgi:hypothetical protein